MKPFSSFRRRRRRGGFSLVEATFSIGLMSFGFLTLIPLLALGMKTTRQAKTDKGMGQIAQTLVEEAKLGSLASGTVYLNEECATCNASQAAYTVQASIQPFQTTLSQLTLHVTPLGAPDRARVYAVVFQAQP
jgi:uncharacterized protein (TIGR02598 family)